MFASVLIVSEASRTLPVGLSGIIGQYQVDWGLLLAGATLTTLPVIILFSFCRAAFCRGVDRRRCEIVKQQYYARRTPPQPSPKGREFPLSLGEGPGVRCIT